MDRKPSRTVSRLLLGGGLLLTTLTGCITPGLPYLEPPGFSSTYHHLDLNRRGAWMPTASYDASRAVSPAPYFPEYASATTGDSAAQADSRAVTSSQPGPGSAPVVKPFQSVVQPPVSPMNARRNP